MAVLKLIEARDYDVLAGRPALSKWRKSALLAKVFLRTKLGLRPLAHGGA